MWPNGASLVKEVLIEIGCVVTSLVIGCHARDKQRPTTNDQWCHDTAYLNKRLFY